jgi:GNAT superfamily N-acetyltransferase
VEREPAMSILIEILSNPSAEDKHKILSSILSYNEQVYAGGGSVERVVALTARDESSGETLGNLWGKILYKWLFLELLFVEAKARNKGIGSRLISEAELIARSQECEGIWLFTHDFQAPNFYGKLGYSIFGSLTEFPPSSKSTFMQKKLRD